MEGFGAELVRAEPIVLDVGCTVNAMRRKVSVTDYAQVFAADEATDKMYSLTFDGTNFTALLSCYALH